MEDGFNRICSSRRFHHGHAKFIVVNDEEDDCGFEA